MIRNGRIFSWKKCWWGIVARCNTGCRCDHSRWRRRIVCCWTKRFATTIVIELHTLEEFDDDDESICCSRVVHSAKWETQNDRLEKRRRGEKRDGKQKNRADVRHRSCSSSSQRWNYLNLLDISLVLVYFSYTVPDDDVSSRPMDRRWEERNHRAFFSSTVDDDDERTRSRFPSADTSQS